MVSSIKSYLKKDCESSPLAVYRIAYGLLMFLSILRFWSYGWIEKLYINPIFHFSYYGFEWIKPIGQLTYLIFIICAISSLLIAIGYKYQIAIITFFLSFTYIELMDKTTYLNHYYFISISSFLMIFLPASAKFSIDSYNKKISYSKIPKWTIDSIKLLIGLVYFFAGLAKINSDWLLKAMPLKIWLPLKYDIPIIGESLMHKDWFHYFMSWGGMIYDLSIPFLLLYKKTRLIGFLLVIFFHAFTKILFPIGMFPYIMIVGALIFFESNFHNKILTYLSRVINKIKSFFYNKKTEILTKKGPYGYKTPNLIYIIISVFFLLQILLPFRHILYPGELFWNEEGYRFSWRVMLMEKIGYTTFKVKNIDTGNSFYVENKEFLTPFQEKQMSFQPDFIIEYAHFLGKHYKELGNKNISIYADSYVALNGRRNRQFVDPKVNLLNEKRSLRHYSWIIPLNDEIKGF